MTTMLLTKLIAEDFPNLPPYEPERIANQLRRDGTVWHDRSLPIAEQVRRAVTAWCRHRYTEYDDLISRGVSKDEARRRTQARLVKTLESWQGK
jgi:hypothetical protein